MFNPQIEEVKEYLNIPSRYDFEQLDDLNIIGDVKSYNLIAKNSSNILLKHKDADYYSLISLEPNSCLMYFYEDAKDYYDHIKDDIYSYKKSCGEEYEFDYDKWLLEDFGIQE